MRAPRVPRYRYDSLNEAEVWGHLITVVIVLAALGVWWWAHG